MSRNLRQEKIIEIIENKIISTQSELVEELINNSFMVTQATVSRDIKDLGLVKEMGKNNILHYSYVLANKHNIDNKFCNLFKEAVTNIDYANNIVVIKTLIGSANTAAAMIDNMQLDDVNILGTVAGDDAIIIVVKTEHDAEKLVDILKEFR